MTPITPRATSVARSAAVTAAGFLLVLALSPPVLSQTETGSKPPDRTKFGLHIGPGLARIQTGGDEGVFGATASTPDDWTVGFGFEMDYGYRTEGDFYVEFILNGWVGTLSGDLGNEDWFTGFVGGGFRWYPMGRGLYLRSGFGGGFITASLTDGGENTKDFDDVGLGIFGTLGYDIAITERFSTGPRLEVVYTDVGDGVNAINANAYFTFNWD